MSYHENQISDQIDGGIHDENIIYEMIENFSKKELKDHIDMLKYKLSEMNDNSSGNDDSLKSKWIIERDLRIFIENLYNES